MSDELIIKINLQLFANPEDEGRTEEPSEKKLREARDKGKVAKTQELSSALVLIVTFFVLFFISKSLLGNILEFMRGIFSNLHRNEFNSKNYRNIMVLGGMTFGKALLPIMLAAGVVAFFAEVVQVGFKFSAHPLKPEMSKISFTFEKLRDRLLFSRKMLVNLLKAVLKVIIIVSISILTIRADYGKLMKTMHLGLLEAVGVLSWTAFKMILWVSIVMVFFSLFDYLYQRWEHRQSLKMTVHEVKEERKQYEGDPQIKAKQKERFRAMVIRKIMQEVPKADVVVTNPTHFAVALQYDSSYMMAAQVTAKGADLIAHRIKDLANDNNVPVVENKPLARALYNDVDIGEEIPPYLYESVAEVLSYVYKMDEEAI